MKVKSVRYMPRYGTAGSCSWITAGHRKTVVDQSEWWTHVGAGGRVGADDEVPWL